MTNRKTINLILLVLLVATVVVSESRGQITDAASLQTYIEKNAELLRDAELLVRSTNSVKARATLEVAYRLHKSSIQNFESRFTAVATTSARRAREAILKAIQLAKRETKLEENAHKAIERATRRNEQARTLFDETGGRDDVRERKLIEESSDLLLRARTNLREHVFGVAIQSADASLDMSDKAIQLLKKDSASPELVLRELERTDQLLGRIDERIVSMGNGETSRLFDEAKRLQNNARTNAGNNRHSLAFKETKQARAIARRIVNQTGDTRNTSKETVTQALALTDELIDRARQIASDNRNKQALDRIGEASRIEKSAHDAYRDGRLEQALDLTHRAREITRDTIGNTQQTIDTGSVLQALTRTDKALDTLRDALETSGNKKAAGLYRRATKRQKRARAAFESGDVKAGLASTKVAINLANEALSRLKHR